MADTPRTLSALLTSLFQDGQAAGSITPQDMRDFLVSVVMSADAATPQTVAGVKTFSSSPVVPTVATSDNSTNAASTAFAHALADPILAQNLQAGTTYTLALSDLGKIVRFSSASAITLTIPTNASVAFQVGSVVQSVQYGAGQITVAGAAGVTLRSGSTLTSRATYSLISFWQIAANEWLVYGDLT